jgi:hypothetical protein
MSEIDFHIIDISSEEDRIEQHSDIFQFAKIKKYKFDDADVKTRIHFVSASELFTYDSPEETNLEADYAISFLSYKYFQKKGEILSYVSLDNNVIGTKFFDDFIQKANVPLDSCLFGHRYNNKKTKMVFLYIFMEDLILYYDGHTTYVLYSKRLLDNRDSSLFTLLGIIKNYKTPVIRRNKIYVVYRSAHGFEKKDFDVRKRNINLKDNYNEEFPEISSEIVSKLNDKDKTGLVILHGEPGTGKTTYIRYLASQLKKNIIFIPPDMVNYITSPDFIPFLMDNSNSILIIEDAEPALQKRAGDSRSGAVSNILNMTDGLLSDCVNISIVATFNTAAKDIDEALLRKGRLLKSYKFDKLEIPKAQALMKKVGKDIEINSPMSLAEIYFYGDDSHPDTSFERRRVGLGFSK